MARKKSFQRGSVREQKYKSGPVYILRYRIRNPDGTWTEKSETLRGCPSKKAALKELADRLEIVNGANGGAPYREEKRFSELLTCQWPDYLDNRGVKPSTRYSYDAMLKHWIKPFFGDMLLGEIDAAAVGRFMAKLAAAGLSAKYRRSIYSLAKLLFEIAAEYDLLSTSPVRPKVHRPKVDRKEKPVFSASRVKSMLEVADPIYRAPMATLAMTGIRAGELLGLQWRDLDFLSRRITIERSVWRGQLQTTKTEASERVIGMPHPLAQVLVNHRRTSSFTAPDDFVFCRADGRPIDPDSFREHGIYAAMKKAGIPYVKRASGCHAFRHLAGSIIHKETGSLKLAQKQLGHSNVSTTGDIYTHVEDQEMDGPASILGSAFGDSVAESVAETLEGSKNVQ